jgi:integration host factor subunit alpha
MPFESLIGPGKTQRERIMNKNDISRKVHETHGGLSYAESQKIVDLMLETIKERLSRGEKVLISGFGCFSVMKRKEKNGVNPQTGDPVVIHGRNAVKFKPSKYLKTI